MNASNLPVNNRELRLQVFLAKCGIASRRECELLIKSGRVRVNGKIITSMGTKVTPGDSVEFDGKLFDLEKRLVYIALHKPVGYICSRKDTLFRPTVYDLIPPTITERVFTLGRLDYRSSGLILLTNNGYFASNISHPSAEIEKEYIVDVNRLIPDAIIDGFMNGLSIDNEIYRCKWIERLGRKTARIILVEGKNKEIRRVFSSFNISTERLIRLRIGSISLGALAEGYTRDLSPAEQLDLNNLSLGALADDYCD